ncbi:hypothetical protein B0H16DRAFT_1879368 [Mycena metata]|uniref:Uncharacterized protein n=1 Tax=Mycena metata TaxID=1033252 RepID=A0AAD7K7H9_9AGAR|nr:hypothetical protein B0H16DRAFT_1879368 [Mycena metata]
MSTTTVTRRLSARRGSTTAPDPYAKNAHLIRESSSILTIVRVSSPPTTTPSTPAVEAPPSPRRAHRRIGSNPNTPLPSPGSPDPPSGRLSFAFSSFGAPHQASSGGGPSPRPRPASPHRAGSASSFSQPRLSPEQLLEVAKQATNPRYVPSPAVTPLAASHSPVIYPRSSSPLGQHSTTVAPATFTPLPPDVYLPFLDRPAEVSALLSSPPSAKLFALLAQTFPKTKNAADDGALPHNTADWTFAHLAHWLTQTTRDEASDAFWVQTARRCILLHSELIWERLKGALGVPPELDVEYTEAEYHDVFESDEESGDEQQVHMQQKGRWENWGSGSAAVLDSPVFDRPSPSASRTNVEQAMSRASTETSSSTPTIMTQLPTPALDEYFSFSPSELGPSGSEIFIEPVLALDQSVLGPNPPPLSLPASLSGDASSLGDIGEEEEDEDSSANATPAAAAAEVVEPPQVHGLRISTPTSGGAPPPGIRSATTGAPMRSPSFSARRDSYSHPHSPVSMFPRSSSSGSLRLERSASFGSVRSMGSSSSGYDPVADRAPGNPIFPSNFARLAVGPTLAANNPSLRSPTLPPQSRFSLGRRSSSTRSIDQNGNGRGNRFRRGTGTGTGEDGEVHYTATFASSSSAGSVRDG